MFRSGRILAIAALVLPAMATATEISYDYVQVAFVTTELDLGPVNVDGDGFNIQGSVSATKNARVTVLPRPAFSPCAGYCTGPTAVSRPQPSCRLRPFLPATAGATTLPIRQVLVK